MCEARLRHQGLPPHQTDMPSSSSRRPRAVASPWANPPEREQQRETKRQAVLAAAFEGKLTGRHTDTETIEDMVASHRKVK